MGGELVSAHMLQHELLMVVAAPLLVMGQPLLVGLWALPICERRRVHATSLASAGPSIGLAGSR